MCLLGTVLGALYRNYDVVLIRDCTLATELPVDAERGMTFTERLVLWFEYAIGTTITTEQRPNP